MSKQFCEYCGAQLEADSAFCSVCGKPVAQGNAAFDAPAQQSFATQEQPPYAPPQGYAAPNQQPYSQSQGYAAPGQWEAAAGATPQKGKKGLSTGAIIGITAGSVFLLAALVFLGIKLFGNGMDGNRPSGQASSGAASPITNEATDTAPSSESAVASPDMHLTSPTAVPTDEPKQLTVTNAEIPIEHAESIGTIRYSGTVDESGLPNGEGTGKMEADAEGASWTYVGMWEHGHFCGRGELTHHTENYVQSGEFKNDVLNGYGTQVQDGVLRYEGEWLDDDMHGQGKLYTKTGELLYEGAFDHNLLVETQAERERRAAPFMEDCESMDTAFYASWEDGYDVLSYPLAVWGPIIGMSEQGQTGTVIINMSDDPKYPVALAYRYSVDEPKVTSKDGAISAWGYCVGTFEYTIDKKPATCPQIEVVYWVAGID